MIAAALVLKWDGVDFSNIKILTQTVLQEAPSAGNPTDWSYDFLGAVLHAMRAVSTNSQPQT